MSRVPQGTVLACSIAISMPYINDLPSSIHSNIRLYADDALVYRSINSHEDSEILQQDLVSLCNWSHKWLMPFNPTKCEYLKITNKVYSIQSHYYLDGTLIKETDHIKYLGVCIDNKLTWNKHIDSTVIKATIVKNLLQRNLKHCPVQAKQLLCLYDKTNT